MVRAMIAENHDWRHDAANDVEMMRTILEAYAAGKIELPVGKPRGRVRYIITPQGVKKPYTIDCLIVFTRWGDYKVTSTLEII